MRLFLIARLCLFIRISVSELVPDGKNRFWIRNIDFTNCHSAGSGGAISVEHLEGILICEGLIFRRCSSTVFGGCIYFSGCPCAHFRICGSDCNAKYASFIYISVENLDIMNYYNESLWHSCVSEQQGSVWIRKSQWLCSNLNATNNSCSVLNGAGLKVDYTQLVTCRYSSFQKMTTNNCIDCCELASSYLRNM